MFRHRIESKFVFILTSIVQLMLCLLILSHLLSSAWYLIGDANSDGRNWIDANRLSGEPLPSRYFASLHWIYTHFAFGSSMIQPQNDSERIFSILVMIVGMVIFAWLTSIVTTSMIELQTLHGEASKQFWLLRSYLRQHDVPSNLSERILNYADSACKQKLDMIPESNVVMLTYLSDQLSSELTCAVSYSGLFFHPLVDHVNMSSQKLMTGLTQTAFERKSFASKETLFIRGSQATRMDFIISGECKYLKTGRLDLVLGKNDWLCEAALWVPWVRRGSTLVLCESQCISVYNEPFAVALKEDPKQCAMARAYAEAYVAWINDVEPENLTDVSSGDHSRAMAQQFMGAGSSKRVSKSVSPLRQVADTRTTAPAMPSPANILRRHSV